MLTSLRNGRSSSSGWKPAPSNLAAPRVAKRIARSAWRCCRTWMFHRVASENAGKHWALLARQVSTSGGAIDTEQNELAVKPHQRPSESLVVTIVAPLGNDDMASRKASEEVVTGVPPFEALLGAVQPRLRLEQNSARRADVGEGTVALLRSVPGQFDRVALGDQFLVDLGHVVDPDANVVQPGPAVADVVVAAGRSVQELDVHRPLGRERDRQVVALETGVGRPGLHRDGGRRRPAPPDRLGQLALGRFQVRHSDSHVEHLAPVEGGHSQTAEVSHRGSPQENGLALPGGGEGGPGGGKNLCPQ